MDEKKSPAEVLTLGQQKQALSSKKARKIVTKQVLAESFPAWSPEPKLEEQALILQLLEEVLTHIRRPESKSLPWRELKNLSKEERREKRLAATTSDQPPSNESLQIRHSLVFGFNAVSRSIEHKRLQAVLVGRDTACPLLTEPLAEAAVHNEIPVVTLSNLRETTKKAAGFPSSAVGILKSLESEHTQVTALVQKIESVWDTFELPPQFLDTGSTRETSPVQNDVPQEKPQPSKQFSPESVYLHRSSKDRRVFIPGADNKTKEESTMELSFIPLQSDSDSEQKHVEQLVKRDISRKMKRKRSSSEFKFILPTVLSVSGNPDKVKSAKKRKKR